jgi:hypothetical protein
MDHNEFEAWETRIRSRADQLWRDAGKPDGGAAAYHAQARELIALEEVPLPGLDADEASRSVIEEASIQGNLGEFPTLTDQGEEQTYPHAQDGDGPRLSDGDASEDGGVLPIAEQPGDALADAAEAEADITSSSENAGDGPENPDLNDDGMPDARNLDEDVEGEMLPGDEYEDSAPPR